jgi:excisionase family DNA binding protein
MHSLMTKADAAQVLHVTPETVLNLERRGRLRALRTRGGVRLFDSADVERLAQERAAARDASGRRDQ